MGFTGQPDTARVSAWPANWQSVCLALLLLVAAPAALGDNLDDARRLMKAADVAEGFEQAARLQAQNVIRTYSSIVAMSTGERLPNSLKQEISRCYEEAFAWERFEPGIAEIFATNLSETEMKLLIDFYSDKSVPPPRIGQFKAIISRAEAIEQLAIDYMLSQTEGCDAQNVTKILDFLADQGS